MKSYPRSVVVPLESRRLLAAVSGSVDFGQTHQTIDGFGASFVHYVGPQLMPQLQQASFYDGLANDLGASAVRGEINQNFEYGNDNNDPNTFNWAGFNNASVANVFTYFQRMKERGVKTFLLTVWSPPFWMKTNNATAGGGFLRPEMRSEFAEWVAAAVITAKRDFGVEISAVGVQNEQFFHEWYESSLMDNVMLRETTLAVQKKFAAEGLKTKVLANEDLGFADTHRWQWFNDPVLADPQIDRSKLLIGSHFTFNNVMNQQANQLAGTGVPLWFTEASGRANTWSEGLVVATEISETLTKANASAYFFWQYDNITDSDWNANTGLLNNGVPTAKYDAAKHMYKYIRPGMERVTTTSGDASSYIAAFKDPKNGASTITLVNTSAQANTYTLNVSNFAPGTVFRVWQSTELAKWVAQPDATVGSTMTLTLPAQSIVTLYSGADLPVQTGSGGYASPDWTIKDAVGNSSLRFAAYIGDVPSITAALLNEDVNAADPMTGWTALHAAAASPFSGGIAALDYLIAHGANVNAVDNKGWTPLHAVAANAWQQWDPNGQWLIDRVKAKINSLVDAGANVNARDTAGETPLHLAAAIPLMYSEWGYNTSILSQLITRGADKTILDNSGKSAYDLATRDYREAYEDFFAVLGAPTDTTPPTARFVGYNADANSIDVTTTEDSTASFTASDVSIVNIDTNTPVTNWTFSDFFNYGITIGKINLTARLPDGRYRMTIAAGAIADQLNLPSTAAIVLNFKVLRGDVNSDGVVNFDDLLTLTQNYGKSNRRWSAGDFTGDGVVNFDDLLMLSQRYGTALTVATPATTSVAGKNKQRPIDAFA